MRRACTGFASAVCCLLSFAVAAEPDDAVVVTATRFADAKRDLPVGVTVITADDLSKSASANLAEILAQFGLLHIRDSAGSPNQQLDLRGFGDSDRVGDGLCKHHTIPDEMICRKYQEHGVGCYN